MSPRAAAGEKVADAIARAWGFWLEEEAFAREAPSEREGDAIKLLKKRLGEIGRGKLIGPTEERVTFEGLATDYIQDHALRGSGSEAWAKQRVAHLRLFFETDRALDITTSRVRGFAKARLDQGANPATVNRDLAALRRMFNLATKADRLTSKPHIAMLEEGQPRQGFFEHAEYAAIRTNLPGPYQAVLDFGYLTGGGGARFSVWSGETWIELRV